MKNLIKYTLVCCAFAFVINAQAQGALDLDGGNDYVSLGANISLGDYTKEAWVNWEGDTNYQSNILSGSDASPHAFWFPGTSGGKLSAGHSGSFTRVQDPVAMPTNVWTHIAVTYNATTGAIILYKNGVEVASATETPGFTSSVFYIGSYNTGYFYNGMIDDVRLWSTVRTPAEIAANYNQCLTGSEPGLVALYKFEDGTGSSIATDSSGSGHDGTLSNMNTSTAWVSSSDDVCASNNANELYVENSAVSKAPNETNSVGSWVVADVGDVTLTTSTDSNRGSYSLEAQGTGRYKSIEFASSTLFEAGKTYILKFWIKAENISAYVNVVSGFSYVHNEERPGSPLVSLYHMDGTSINEWILQEWEVTSNGDLARIHFSPGSRADTVNHKVWLSEFSVEEKVEADTTAPQPPTLTSSSNTDVTVDLNWSGASDDTAVTGYKVYKDGVLETTLGNVLTYQVTGLTPETAYNFTVTALDAASNESTASNQISVTTDATTNTEIPTAPTLSSSSITDSSVILSWTASTDNVGIAAYRVYQDGSYLATTGSLTRQVTGLSPSTSYDFYVTAVDGDSNVSDPSNVVSITTTGGGGGGTTSGNWNIDGQDLYYNSGNVGIGTTTPDEKLAVNGSIHSQEVRVDLLGWPDYVFEDHYNLPSLKEVEKHIKQNGHLQNIPSAQHVHKNGLKLGSINAKLLEKIEELTLYAIQQQKEIDIQKAKNEALEARLKTIEILLKN